MAYKTIVNPIGKPLDFVTVPTDVSGLVPYTGATGDLDLGTHDLTTTGEITGEIAKVQSSAPTAQVGNLWLDPSETAVDTTDHAQLTNKDFASSGHTGFQPAGSYLTTGFVFRGLASADDFTQATLTTDGTWRDLDLSSIVPAGAVAIELVVSVADDAVNSSLNFRKNLTGSTDYTRQGLIVNSTTIAVRQTLIVPCDTNRIIEYNATNTTWTAIQITVIGWFL